MSIGWIPTQQPDPTTKAPPPDEILLVCGIRPTTSHPQGQEAFHALAVFTSDENKWYYYETEHTLSTPHPDTQFMFYAHIELPIEVLLKLYNIPTL